MNRFTIRLDDSICPGAASVALALPGGKVTFSRRPDEVLEHEAELTDELALELASVGYQLKPVKATPKPRRRARAAKKATEPEVEAEASPAEETNMEDE
jgi:hypothetical protein